MFVSTHVDTTLYYVTGSNGAWRVVRNNDIGIVPIASLKKYSYQGAYDG